MKSSMYNISEHINELIDNRIFKDYTVDAVLQDNSIRLERSNADALYTYESFNKSINSEKLLNERRYLFYLAQSITKDAQNDFERIKGIMDFTAGICENFPLKNQNNEKIYKSPTEYFWGGTEELIIAKGSDWCAELARVFCALCQCSGIASRIIYTFSEDDGHIINEAFLNNKWILIDSTNGFIYQYENKYISLKDLVFNKEFCEKALKPYQNYYYSKPAYFNNVYISDYRISDFEKYNYEISFCNEYYKKALSAVWNSDG